LRNVGSLADLDDFPGDSDAVEDRANLE